MKRLLLALIALPLLAADTYVYDYEVTLSGAAGKVTLQQPATNVSTRARLVTATLYSDTAAAITLERSCTSAATATAQTPVRLSTGTPASTLRVYTASNASTCTALKKYNVAAGQELVVDLAGMSVDKAANANVGFAVASMTGTVRVFLMWQED